MTVFNKNPYHSATRAKASLMRCKYNLYMRMAADVLCSYVVSQN